MDEKEKKGSVFPKSLNDYKAVVRSEAKRTFSFMPDAPCRNPREFTEELLKFANKEGLNIVITKESMSPHFEIDGIEYYAYRKAQDSESLFIAKWFTRKIIYRKEWMRRNITDIGRFPSLHFLYCCLLLSFFCPGATCLPRGRALLPLELW